MEYLEDTQDFDEDALPDFVPLDSGENSYNDEINESVAEGGDRSNNNSSPPVHVETIEYENQKMNVHQLKDNLTKTKNLDGTKTNLMKYF